MGVEETTNRARAPIAALSGSTNGDLVDALVTDLVRARRSGSSLGPGLADSLTPAQARAVQAGVLAALHDPVGGWKAAGLSPEGYPLAAPIHAPDISATSARTPRHPEGWDIEVELGFRLGRDIAPGSIPDGEALLSAIAEVVVCLELCRSRLTSPASRLLFLADGLANDGVAVGDGVKGGPGLDLVDRHARLLINGEPAGRGCTGTAATATLLWLTGQPLAHGGLRAGQLVITGSLTGLARLRPGDVADAEIEGIGRLRFAAERAA